MKITVVVENTVSTKTDKPLLGQHGLSMLLEHGGKRLLFDTAQSGILTENLALLGIHPDSIDAVLLSHGHYDHTGGLKAFLQHRSKPVDVYIGRNFFVERFAVHAGKKEAVSVPYTVVGLETAGAQFHTVSAPLELWPGLWASGAIPRTNKHETGVTTLTNGIGLPDAFDDELAVYATGGKGLTAVTGCAHRGILNIVEYGMQVTGATKVGAIIGGTHLGPASAAQKEATIEQLLQWQPALVAANHCTGLEMMAELAARLGAGVFKPASAGIVLEIAD